MAEHRRFVLTPSTEQPLPIYVESIGYNHDQERIVRQHGHPIYHWIQTEEGEGTVDFDGKKFSLPPNSGVLLFPDVSHTYERVKEEWGTIYLTFGGPAVPAIIASLQLHESAFFRWEKDTPFSTFLTSMLDRIESQHDPFGLNASVNVYQFMITLRKYGQLHNNTAISRNLEKLQPLIEWMDAHFPDPNIDLNEMAVILDISARRLNTLFRETFGLSPYAFFLFLRIRKSKEILISQPNDSVKLISNQVGFRDSSHFVATFRKHVGITPEQFRKLH